MHHYQPAPVLAVEMINQGGKKRKRSKLKNHRSYKSLFTKDMVAVKQFNYTVSLAIRLHK
jgi:hypothetical protein